MKRFSAPSLLLVTLLAASVARADTRVDVTPSVAYFDTRTDVVDQEGVTARYAGAPAFGGRLSIWLNDRVALEGSAHYGRTTLDGTLFGETAGSLDLALFYGSAQIGVALDPARRLILHGGLGVQGTNYDELIEGANLMTGVAGLGAVLPLNRSLALRVDLDVHLHTSYFELGDFTTDELSQVETVLAVGLQFGSGGQ